MSLGELANRYEALELLAERGPQGPDDWDSIVAALQAPEDPVRILACRAAALAWSEGDCPQRLLVIARSDPSSEVQFEALRALGPLIEEGALWSSCRGPWDEDPTIKIAQEKSQPVLDELRRRLKDSETTKDQRAGALEALGVYAAEDWVAPQVGAAWYSTDRRLRVAAVGAAGRSGHQRWRKLVREALEEAVQKGDEVIFRRAILALGRIGLHELTKVVAAQARERRMRPAVREAAFECLANLNSSAARRVLNEIATRADDRMADQAALWLIR